MAQASTSRFTPRVMRRIVYGVCYAPLAMGIGYISYVKLKLNRAQHRAVTPMDQYYIRDMRGQCPTITTNPGIRVEKDFLTREEQDQLRLDARILINHYGYSVIPFYVRANFQKQVMFYKSRVRVNAFKATGRAPDKALNPPRTPLADELKQEHEELISKTEPYEYNKPDAAPWGTSHTMDVTQLPPSVQQLIDKIERHDGYSLGSVRDVTIDFRDYQYYRVDPHIYPQQDGTSVFMVTLDSDTVISLLPPSKDVHRRSKLMEINNASYSDGDLDILHCRGDLLCLSNKARHELDWCIRQGVDCSRDKLLRVRKRMLLDDTVIPAEEKQKSQHSGKGDIWDTEDEMDEQSLAIVGNLDILEKNKQDYILCDWWGTRNYVVPRNQQRLTISVAFSRPT